MDEILDTFIHVNYTLNQTTPLISAPKNASLLVYQPPNAGNISGDSTGIPNEFSAGRTLTCWGSALSFSGAIGWIVEGATLGESEIQ